MPLSAAEKNTIKDQCLSASDYKGCIESLSKNDVNKRVVIRKNGKIVIINIGSLRAIPFNGKFGRFLEWSYEVDQSNKKKRVKWTLAADCEKSAAKWEGANEKWVSLDSSAVKKSESLQEAKALLDEFCPQMNRLVKQERGNKNSEKSILEKEIILKKSIKSNTERNKNQKPNNRSEERIRQLEKRLKELESSERETKSKKSNLRNNPYYIDPADIDA